MSLFKKVFSSKEEPINTNADFWNWFKQNEKKFYHVVKSQGDIEKDFFDAMAPKLAQLGEGYFFLTGMYDDETAELILTPDGAVEKMAMVEDLVHAAPTLQGWRFTAFKPSGDIDGMNIHMQDLVFSKDNIFFYSNDHTEYPDEIDITLVYKDFTPRNEKLIKQGLFIYLDNMLGEWDSVTLLDNVNIVPPAEAEKELVPISKLKDFLVWRQKEFIEKYDAVRYDTEKDEYSLMKAELEDGKEIIVAVNTDLLDWDATPSHPWILTITITYEADEENGMPYEEEYKKMNELEDEMMQELKDSEGYLNIGRETGNGQRIMYWACKEFKQPSRVMYEIQKRYNEFFDLEFEIFKDKYWTVLDKYRQR